MTLSCRFTPAFITSVLIYMGSGSSFRGTSVIARWEIVLLRQYRSEFCQCGECLVPAGNFAWIVLVVIYLSYSLVA